MPLLQDSPIRDIKRLLELFPLSNLRAAWPNVKGSKEEICTGVAEDRAQLDNILAFMDENLGCCRQHVYIFDHDGTVQTVPENIDGAELVHHIPGVSGLYVVRATYEVVLKDPPEQDTIDFLWPFRIEITATHLILRFVVLEKSLSSYFERQFYLATKSVEEDTITEALTEVFNINPTDLHKGIKELWDHGFMDSVRVDYKKPLSKASETMDEEKGIKEHDPELYELLQGMPLLNTLFAVKPTDACTVSVFSAKPARGYLAFLRYTERKGDTDYVLREILQRNQ